MLSATAPTLTGPKIPTRSNNRPIATPPAAKPSMARVNGNVASARGMANSDCTAGSATTTDHMPTPPMVESSTVAARRSQACVESVAGRVAGLFAGFDSAGFDSSSPCIPMTCTGADTSSQPHARSEPMTTRGQAGT